MSTPKPGPTEAINGRLEHIAGRAGFRNLTNYIARSLLGTGESGPNYTLDRERPARSFRDSTIQQLS